MKTPANHIDLVALRRACGPVIAWYERFLAEQRLDLHELNDAVEGLRLLPPVGGRLGRAMSTIVSGGQGVAIEEVVVAFELLCGATGLRAPSAPSAGGTSAGGTHEAQVPSAASSDEPREQLQLPGMP